MRNIRAVVIAVSLVALSGCQTVSESKLPSQSATMPVNLRGYVDDRQVNSTTREIAAHGLKAMDEGDLEQASMLFNTALRLDLTNSYLQYLNGLTYHLTALAGDAEKFALAEQGYRMAYKFDNSNWLAKYYLGLSLLDQRRFAEAQSELAVAAILNESDPEVLYDLAYSSYYAGDPVTAHGALNKLRARHPEAASDARILRGLLMTNAALGHTVEQPLLLASYQGAGMAPAAMMDVNQRLQAWDRFHEFSERSTARTAKALTEQAAKVIQLAENAPSADAYAEAIPGASARRRSSASAATLSNDAEAANDMVVVDVVIIRTQEDISSTRGFNLLSGLEMQFGDPLSVTPGLSFDRIRTYGDTSTDASAITQLISIPSVNYSLNIFNTLAGRNEILARPSLVALSGRTSEFFSGVDVVAAAVSGGDGSAVSITKEIGVKLAVKPEFLASDKVRLEVEAERTFLTTPSSSVVFEFRLDTSKTTVNANVVMSFGETLVLSGLTEEESEKSRDSVPFLGDIPVLQYLFAKESTREFRKSVIILLTPRRTHYVNRAEEDRLAEERGLSSFEQSVRTFEHRNENWFVPRSTISDAFASAQQNMLFQEFKTGDFAMESWHKRDTHSDRLKHALSFLFY